MTNDLPQPVGSARYELFPTTVMAFEHDEGAMNEEIARHFQSDPRYRRKDHAERSDSFNLMDFAGEVPAFARLQQLFIAGLRDYCRETGVTGEFDLAMQMFPNVAPARHYVPAHNHVAHIAAVYYVQTPESGRAIVDHESSMEDYWRTEEGVLILQDPRHNASLNGLWQRYARVYPRPGLLIMFPAFVWHEVTPHFSNAPRLSVAANFTLEPRDRGYQRKIAIAVE